MKPITDTEYAIRLRLFNLGKLVRDTEMDKDDQTRIGNDLIALSGVCPHCHGDGIDGEPPDAAGVGGGQWACEQCKGTGFVIPSAPL